MKLINRATFTVQFSTTGNGHDHQLDLGAVTLMHKGRCCMLDVTDTEIWYSDTPNVTHYECRVKPDEDTFHECAYDLTERDLLKRLDVATLYAASEDTGVYINNITLVVTTADYTLTKPLFLEH
jgi:hypothetical protein